MDLRTNQLSRLTNTQAIDTGPCFSPAGRRIVFASRHPPRRDSPGSLPQHSSSQTSGRKRPDMGKSPHVPMTADTMHPAARVLAGKMMQHIISSITPLRGVSAERYNPYEPV